MTNALPRWNLAIVVLHWINAALILGLLGLGWIMTHSPFGARTTFDLYQAHKSLGFMALALTALRIVARAASAAPARVSGWEGRIARAVQAAFYVLTLAAIAAGWLVVSASPLPVPTQFFGLFVVPNIAAPEATLFANAVLAHALTAYVIAALVTLHVAGALKHHLLDRDDALRRMLPRRGNT